MEPQAESAVCGGIKTCTHTHTQIHYVYVHWAYVTTFVSGSSSATSALPAASATVSSAALAASSSSPRQQLHLIVSKICENFFQGIPKTFQASKVSFPQPPSLSLVPFHGAFLPIPLISLNMSATCCFHVILHCQAQLCVPSGCVCVCACGQHVLTFTCWCICVRMCLCVSVFICRSAKCMMIFQLVIFIFAFRQRL